MLKNFTAILAISFLAVPMAQAEKVHLAVASNFTGPAKQLAETFQRTSGHKAVLSFGSTGKLYAQIIHGAPFDIFLAADAERPSRLVFDGLALEESLFTYAVGRLALYSPTLRTSTALRNKLESGDFQRLAIANPKTAPYGLAAEELLGNLKINTKGKLVFGENIAQTYQFVASGNADLGLVAAAQLKASDSAGWMVPETLHAPIRQQAVLLNRGKDNPAARAFLAFLRSDPAGKMIRSFGYGLGEG
ncbi:molybdate ABC transporter substrate-binding protein [Aestuariispira insulae]|uniref:Molybdate transport system substrate-binding protein n=1 Tax=Aestuariispira insulae TaxID=1461337 RepID=A0A3D9H2M0_9PROT|nr:molybdate ABC transporter substrate-binding protein [Aestuariispira insulae]RED43753.1 molybdate transport system substrate-binding protein [Aestuariispira insulae]